MHTLLYFELATTAALVGLVWVVQLVHYPAFLYVADEQFSDFHQLHTRQITWVVLPLMGAELSLSAYRCWGRCVGLAGAYPFLAGGATLGEYVFLAGSSARSPGGW
jgi:hypothetical protein